jgi:hypothetical protein
MIRRMTLDYLDFDYSEDTEGVGVFDAMASTGAEQVAAVQAEVVKVLDWAHAGFGAPRGPVGDGGDWDYDLQGMQESSVAQSMIFDPLEHRLRVQPGAPARCGTRSACRSAGPRHSAPPSARPSSSANLSPWPLQGQC